MKKFIPVIAGTLVVLLSFTGCKLFQVEQIEVAPITFPSTTAPATTVPPTTQSTTEETTAGETTTAEETTAGEATTAEAVTKAPTGVEIPKGTTARGYDIVEIDGVTYVKTGYGNVLIANKTYALPRDYGPGGLTYACDAAYDELKAGAAADGINIFILSGYRSYDLQTSLYNRYVADDGQAEADTYSARPGHSEHQSGLAIDVNSLSYSFADTPEGQWLAAHAHEYGFIIRYAKNKQSVTGYAYEPWHIRYLGKGLAAAVYESGLCLEEYLGVTSSYD